MTSENQEGLYEDLEKELIQRGNCQTLTDGSADGVNICLTDTGSKIIFQVIQKCSGHVRPMGVAISLDSGRGVELEIANNMLKVSLTDGTQLGSIADLPLSGTGSPRMDGKIGGIHNSPYFIGVEDARPYASNCKTNAVFGDLSSGNRVRLHYADSPARILKVSSSSRAQYLPAFSLGMTGVPYWGCYFQWANMCPPSQEIADLKND